MEQPLHGNYHSYYQTKRPELSDERIALLPRAFFKGRSVLDIGCNEGWVTCERHGATRVVGVDIDPVLIRATWKRRRACGANKDPLSHLPLKKRKRSNIDSFEHESISPSPSLHYFPLSMQHLFGTLPIPGPGSQISLESTSFPHNVSFIRADWLSDPIDSSQQYDIVLALSITKWIHLNNGDAGLLAFFQRIFDILHQGRGSKLVLEPQHWEGYAKAKRNNPKLKESGKDLQIRPDDFEAHLTKIGFRPAQRMGSVGQGGLRRPVDVYEKP
ncbi:hypothetical protein BS47DRAFT_1445318 [Hydnum rufescens UP504]|uniref:RNA methyltransferase n=1 Tax=Hydnum rufescens UP504 TaxID=1448309 RepID=A0A9P6B118_9AGAM|nr:hypothetical protein BS47DRAFT_1445318 [Hydnum rufescens UP504]